MKTPLAVPVRILSGAQVRQLLPFQTCIDTVRACMVEVSKRNVSMPLRHGLPVPNRKGVLGLMYGSLGAPESFGIKLISLFPGNSALGLSTHMGLVALYEPVNGKPVAIMDASAITAVRTASASAVATDQLARKDSSVLAIIGTGEQAANHLQAMLCVRNIKKVRIWGIERVSEFVAECREVTDAAVESAGTVEEAVHDADIVCTVTSAPEPILFGRWVQPGTHLNVVGSSVADRAEVDTELLLKARFFIDYRESTLSQAGEFLKAKKEGAVTDDYIVGEIGHVIAGTIGGRRSEQEITIYKFLGVIAQDLAAAMTVWRQAEKSGIGTVVEI